MPKHSKTKDCLKLDGRTLEGGGQLVRTALCLAALTGTAIQITDIRGNRSGGGGLKAQHLACVRWLAHACNATVQGDEKGSKTLVFEPGHIEGGLSPTFKKRKLDSGLDVYECQLDIGSAGSTGLALQAILPYILFTKFPSPLPIHLTVRGGTNVSGSPSFEYVQQVLLPTLKRIGFPAIKATLRQRGWSHGGTSIGSFSLDIPPRPQVHFPAFTYAPADTALVRQTRSTPPSDIHATIIAPASCHEHFRTVLTAAVKQHLGSTFALSDDSSSSSSSGNFQIICEDSRHDKRIYLILAAAYSSSLSSQGPKDKEASYILASDELYQRKISTHSRAATEMSERVCRALARECASAAWVDEHMRDQLVIFQALAHGESVVFPGYDLPNEQEQNRDGERGEDEDEYGDRDGDAALREPSLHARTAEWVAKRVLRVKFDAEGRCDGYAFGWDGNEPQSIGGGED